MPLKQVLVIHGASRLATIVFSVIQDEYNQVYRYIDPDPGYTSKQTVTDGLSKKMPIITTLPLDQNVDYISSIGYNNMVARKTTYEIFTANRRVTPINIVHPNAFVSPHAKLGTGNLVFPGVVIEDGVLIGDNNIIWSNSCICHDAIVGSHNFIAASSVVGGCSRIGSCIFLGFGSIINENLMVSNYSFLASGSVVTRNIDVESTRVCGVPAKIMGSPSRPYKLY